MRKAMKHSMYLCAIVVTSAMLFACGQKELCFDHNNHASRYATNVEISYERNWQQPYGGEEDWESRWSSLGLGFSYDDLRPGIPEGVRLTSYNSNGVRTDNNLKPYGEVISLSQGINSLLFYNNDTEYIIFNDLESFGQASATTRSRSRSTYKGNPFYINIDGTRDEITVSAPDQLYGHYQASYLQERVSEPQDLYVVMHPLVFTYVIRYRFEHGYDYVALARGALSGMAAGVFLRDRKSVV